MNSRMKITHIALLGIFIGILSFLDFPLFAVLGLALYVVFVCRNIAKTADEQKFIMNACIAAIGLRIVISLILLICGFYKGVGSDIFGDARPYEGVGVYIKELATGIPTKSGLWGENLTHVHWLREAWQGIDERLGGYYSIPMTSYWYAYLYTLWGLDFLAPKILNGLMWVLGSCWLYSFFRERFTQKGLRAGLLIILFLPSFTMFSGSGLKDALLFFLIISIVYSSHMLERSRHRFYAVSILLLTPLLYKYLATSIHKVSFFIISAFIISTLLVTRGAKNWLFYGVLIISGALILSTLREFICLFVLIFSLFIVLVEKINFKKLFVSASLIAILGIFIFGNRLIPKIFSYIRNTMSTVVLQSYNTAYGYNAYHVFPEKYYANPGLRESITYPETFLAFLKGLKFLFFEPTPWAFKTAFGILIFPETLFMWFLFPFIIFGIITMFRLNSRMALPTCIFLFAITMLLTLGQGNMGTLMRIRMMLMPWYCLAAGIGLSAALGHFFKGAG